MKFCGEKTIHVQSEELHRNDFNNIIDCIMQTLLVVTLATNAWKLCPKEMVSCVL